MAKHEFQTEIKQLLNLMIHSLYSHKEIFLRELVSNGSDAIDKLKLLSVSDENYKNVEFTPKLEIKILKDERKLVISDTGIGMNEEDLVEHLGTIAKSGTKAFLENMSGDNKKDSQLIGQFGVGFYSAFMVADKVEVLSKKAGEEKSFKWISAGDGSYEIIESPKEGNGTEITLHIKEGEDEYISEYSIENVIKKYSNHVPFPIYLEKEVPVEKEGEEEPKEGEEPKEPEMTKKLEQINKASALWTLSKSDISDDEYKDFYQTIAHSSEEPLHWVHTRVEGTLDYKTLFYIPKTAPMDLYRADWESGVKLYINRVFISDGDRELLPTYLRFVRGIIDSADLPLNVSREILQNNRILEKIKSSSVKKVISELAKIKKTDSEKYDEFYKVFGKTLKEGLYTDHDNKDKLLDLLLFKSLNESQTDLKTYVEKMGEEQKEIFFINGTDENILKSSPLLEKFKAKNYDVLILDDEVDGIVFPMVQNYTIGSGDDKKEFAIKHVSDVKFDDEKAEDNEENKAIAEKISNALGESVKEVRISTSLVDSPVMLLADKEDQNYMMYQMMKQMGQAENLPELKPILEVNPKSEMIQKLAKSENEDLIADVSNTLLDQARLFNGEEVRDSVKFIERMNRIVSKAL
jgi:molecular chaperone HtpG